MYHSHTEGFRIIILKGYRMKNLKIKLLVTQNFKLLHVLNHNLIFQELSQLIKENK